MDLIFSCLGDAKKYKKEIEKYKKLIKKYKQTLLLIAIIVGAVLLAAGVVVLVIKLIEKTKAVAVSEDEAVEAIETDDEEDLFEEEE